MFNPHEIHSKHKYGSRHGGPNREEFSEHGAPSREEMIEHLHHLMHMKRKHFEFRHGGSFGEGGPFGGRPPFGDGPFGGNPFDGGPFGKGGPGGRQRQRRGDVKFVLLELLKDQPRHGYELIKALEERSGGFYRPSPGLVYPTLQLLEDEGNLTSQVLDDKRVYSITEAGKKLLQERESDQGPEFGPRWSNRHDRHNPDMPQMLDLRRTAMALFESVMQAARYGTPDQVKAVQTLLDTANKEVHSILAQNDTSKTV